MKFGSEPVAEAEGAILAHSIRLGRTILKKGRVLGRADLDAIVAGGAASVTVARLEPGDVVEDEAARLVAESVTGTGSTVSVAETGRVNLHAEHPGLVQFDPAAIDALNAVAEEVTLATLPPFTPVETGRMIATIKIIPFAVRQADLARSVETGKAAQIAVRPFRRLSAWLIQTVHEGVKASVIEKTRTVTTDRLGRIGSTLLGEVRCPHDVDLLATQMNAQLRDAADLLLVIGASAIVDRRDVIPNAIERLGGRVERLGMPVDPGNLILIGEIKGVPVLGLPGCARSPARNGFDWVLERIAAGLPVGHDQIARMGVGGLLIGRAEEKDYL